MDLLYDWPWLGGAFGLVILAVAFGRPMPALGSYGARLSDPRWLCWLPLPVYMLHQVEEHGIDLLGRRYALQAELCATLGSPDVASCPATPELIAVVNVGTVWIAGLAAGLFGPRRPFACAGMVGLVAVNGLAHVGASLRNGRYDPGLATALLLFLPLAIWTFSRLLERGLVTKGIVAAALGVGVAMHVVLLGSALASGRGEIGERVLFLIQIANGFVPLVVSFVVAAPGLREHSGST